MLSAAGTFVSDQKTLASSVIGPRSAVYSGPRLVKRNVDIQESSVNVVGDAPTLAASTAYNMHRHTAAKASRESLSSCMIANSSTSRHKSLHCWFIDLELYGHMQK